MASDLDAPYSPRMSASLLSLALVALPTAAATSPQGPSAALLDFRAGAVAIDGHDYAYKLLEPLPERRDQPRPLVVFLHGAGERGSDNVEQLRWLPELLAEPSRRQALPCFLLALQCPADENWVDVRWQDPTSQPMLPQSTRSLRAVLAAIDAMLARPGVDAARVYLVGLSMGGFGAMDLAARHPDRFAAVMALCGGGDPARMTALIGMPVQLWHGEQDQVVPVARSRALATALRLAGAAVDYRELPEVGHDVWLQAFGHGGGFQWLFRQDQRQQQRGVAVRPPIVPHAEEVTWSDGGFRLQAGSRCIAPFPCVPAAERLVAALSAHTGCTLPIVHDQAPARGDIVFTMEPGAESPLVLEVGEHCTIRARDHAAAETGAVTAAQAMQALPGGGSPRARIVRRALLPKGRVVLPPADGSWPHEDLAAAVRWCWLFGADELAIDPLGCPTAMTASDWQKLSATAARWGVRLVDGEEAPPKGAWIVAGLDAEAIWQLPRQSDAPQPFLLQVASAPAALRLPALVGQLAAVAERAATPAAGVRATFRSRLGLLQRSH